MSVMHVLINNTPKVITHTIDTCISQYIEKLTKILRRLQTYKAKIVLHNYVIILLEKQKNNTLK